MRTPRRRALYGRMLVEPLRMKIKFVLLLAVCLGAGVLSATAQAEAPAPVPAPASDVPPAAESAPSVGNPAETPPSTPVFPVGGIPEQASEAANQPTTSENEETAAATDDNRGPLTLDEDLPTAIEFLAKMARLNIHFDPSITFTNIAGPDGRSGLPRVSLRWENVTAEDALTEVLDIHGLKLVTNQRTGISRVTQRPNISPLVTSIVQLQHTNPTNLVPHVTTIFTEPARSRVLADPRTGQLVILSPERDVEAITNLLARLDTPTKQVLIEAKILETAKNPRSIQGIDWTGTLQSQNLTFGNGVTTGTTTTSSGDSITSTLPSGRSVTSTGGETTKTTLSTLLGSGGLSLDTARGFHPSTAFLNADGVSAVLSFLNSDNETEVVATPRAVTADNETAKLEVTRAFPIFKITPGSANTPAGSEITYTNVGTILNVTPRISANSNVFMKVVPEVSNIDSKDVQTINGQRNEANVYAVRRIEANVVIPSGSTLVMGGLISDTKSKGNTKVPLFGDIPLVGKAFRHENRSRTKANLLIFVTPSIVGDTDFQPTSTDFLQSKPISTTEEVESAWHSGKPVNWFEKKRPAGSAAKP